MMVEEENLEAPKEAVIEDESESKKGCCGCLWTPIYWIKMLATEMHWSFVLGVVIVYGISQGLGGALARVGTQYYMKDVQKVQPSEAQVYAGITSLPWIVKPLWGLLTDVLPIFGYRRRPYFILAASSPANWMCNFTGYSKVASLMQSHQMVPSMMISGCLGVFSMLLLSMHEKLHLVFAVSALTASSAGIAIADVTIDACVAQNSICHPSLASDMQSLCSLCSAIGALIGYSISGIFVHLIGPKVNLKFLDAGKAMWTTLKFPLVWRPCLYMYLSFAVSLNIHEGLFYWYTDSKAGPSFSQETVGFVLSVGPVGSILAAILYQNSLKDYPFQDVLFWAQLLSGLSGMLDLLLVLRLNLKFGIPDFVALVIDEGISRMVGQLKWMPLLVLSSRLCPSGIEGTFFALLMSIDNAGVLSSSWGGGLLLHILKVTRTQFHNLWLAILIRNILRITPLCVIFLVPRGDPDTSFLPAELESKEETAEASEAENIELVALVNSIDAR
ncbi:putative folate-biopterin transporter 2 [Citrus sinensis]|uniref:Folate-biopterin transporter 2 n=2 Tax=Citrus sinensis TaxID=2711 RepID=A0ACB8NLG8_CITSI|nr:putative folate-biopterin transporter 2 [Citrus sinensis]KAH9798728.1 putative folate-biopterin transporter 2 [Citrus sinensis]